MGPPKDPKDEAKSKPTRPSKSKQTQQPKQTQPPKHTQPLKEDKDIAELDSLFAKKKPQAVAPRQAQIRQKPTRQDDAFFDSRGTKAVALTDDGLPVYRDKDLNVGKGGATSRCPFDCDCCF